MISSTANQKVKDVATLAKRARSRKETGLFVVEGPRMAAEIPDDRISRIYVTERFLEEERRKHSVLAGRLKDGGKVETVTDNVMKAMSDTQTPQGILILARQYTYSLDELLKDPLNAHLLILETLQDPGNLGTILRAGEGAGVSGIIMDENTADIYNPKVIRSTMGSVFRVPFVYVKDLEETICTVKKAGIRIFAADLKGAVDYDKEDYTRGIGFLIGNESKGLTDEVASLADAAVKIPMKGEVESLNAAVAASVLMFEAARQRRGKDSDH